jgi:CTP synthase (UTP-ammonia lyase)
MKKLLILGDYDPASETHAATDAAIGHSRRRLKADLESAWVSTESIPEEQMKRCSGIWVAPGSPYRNMENVLHAIRYAREKRVPILGTCGGFQHMVIEYARNILGYEEAQHAEYLPDAADPIISKLACSLRGKEMVLTLSPGSLSASLYGKLEAKERYYCSFGVNPRFAEQLEKGPISIAGSDGEGEIRVIEYPGHPFYIGTLFVPQALSTEDRPHPIVTGFLKAVAEGEGG